MRTLATAALGAAAMMLAACSEAPAPQAIGGEADVDAIRAAAHDAYVAAINTNDPDAVAARMTQDVVFQAPGAPELIGREAVREFVAGYVGAFETRWEKTSIDFTVAGDYAFERYTYSHVDTSRETGEVVTGEGKGVIVFEREDDGVWRVAVDGWSDTRPAPSAEDPETVIRGLYDAFAAGDAEAFAAAMDPAIVWNEAEGNPYADGNPYLGPDAVMTGVAGRVAQEWEGFTATPARFVVQGDQVVVFGRYGGEFKETGAILDAPFVHAFTVTDGRITQFQQYMDTAAQREAMGR